jgi:uncharacterized protein (DUF4415 family)
MALEPFLIFVATINGDCFRRGKAACDASERGLDFDRCGVVFDGPHMTIEDDGFGSTSPHCRKRMTRPISVPAPWGEKLATALLQRGRPRSENPKVSTTIRLDADVLERFRAEGPGWQSRINEALRAWLDKR